MTWQVEQNPSWGSHQGMFREPRVLVQTIYVWGGRVDGCHLVDRLGNHIIDVQARDMHFFSRIHWSTKSWYFVGNKSESMPTIDGGKGKSITFLIGWYHLRSLASIHLLDLDTTPLGIQHFYEPIPDIPPPNQWPNWTSQPNPWMIPMVHCHLPIRELDQLSPNGQVHVQQHSSISVTKYSFHPRLNVSVFCHIREPSTKECVYLLEIVHCDNNFDYGWWQILKHSWPSKWPFKAKDFILESIDSGFAFEITLKRQD